MSKYSKKIKNKIYSLVSKLRKQVFVFIVTDFFHYPQIEAIGGCIVLSGGKGFWMGGGGGLKLPYMTRPIKSILIPIRI